MIQRVQTLYLIIAVILWSILFFFPILTFEGGGNSLIISVSSAELSRGDGSGLENPFSYLPMIVLAMAITITSVAVFLYGKRKIQVFVSLMGMFLGLLFLILLGIEGFNGSKEFLAEYPQLEISAFRSLGLMIPVASLLFILAAVRGIRKDEELVKSLDRIR